MRFTHIKFWLLETTGSKRCCSNTHTTRNQGTLVTVHSIHIDGNADQVTGELDLVASQFLNIKTVSHTGRHPQTRRKSHQWTNIPQHEMVVGTIGNQLTTLCQHTRTTGQNTKRTLNPKPIMALAKCAQFAITVGNPLSRIPVF